MKYNKIIPRFVRHKDARSSFRNILFMSFTEAKASLAHTNSKPLVLHLCETVSVIEYMPTLHCMQYCVWVGGAVEAMNLGDSTHHSLCLTTFLWLLLMVLATHTKKLPRQHQFSSYCFLHSLHLIYLQHESKCNQTDAGTVMCLKFFPKGCVRMKRDLKHLKRIQKGRIAKIGEKMVYNVTLMTFSIAHSGMLTSM